MDSNKVMAVIAKSMRESGFKGKITPHLEVSQIWIKSDVYDNIGYSVRMEGDFPDMFVYMLVDGVWKPVRKKGYICYNEPYDGYIDYFTRLEYDRFADEYRILDSCIKRKPYEKKDFIKDNKDLVSYDEDLDSLFNIKNSPEPDSMFYAQEKKNDKFKDGLRSFVVIKKY